MVKLEHEIVEGLSGRARQHHVIRERTVGEEIYVHSIYPPRSSGREEALAALKELPEEKYELDFLERGKLYLEDGQLMRHGVHFTVDADEIISDGLSHLPEEWHDEFIDSQRIYTDTPKFLIQPSQPKEEIHLSDTPRLIEVLRDRKPKSITELRKVLPISVTNRLGEGEEGLIRTIGMLRNLASYSLTAYKEGWTFNDRTFARDISSYVYFPELNSRKHVPQAYEDLLNRTLEIQRPMLDLALEHGILVEHRGWAAPGEIPHRYLLPPSTQLILRRIFRP